MAVQRQRGLGQRAGQFSFNAAELNRCGGFATRRRRGDVEVGRGQRRLQREGCVAGHCFSGGCCGLAAGLLQLLLQAAQAAAPTGIQLRLALDDGAF